MKIGEIPPSGLALPSYLFFYKHYHTIICIKPSRTTNPFCAISVEAIMSNNSVKLFLI